MIEAPLAVQPEQEVPGVFTGRKAGRLRRLYRQHTNRAAESATMAADSTAGGTTAAHTTAADSTTAGTTAADSTAAGTAAGQGSEPGEPPRSVCLRSPTTMASLPRVQRNIPVTTHSVCGPCFAGVLRWRQVVDGLLFIVGMMQMVLPFTVHWLSKWLGKGHGWAAWLLQACASSASPTATLMCQSVCGGSISAVCALLE